MPRKPPPPTQPGLRKRGGKKGRLDPDGPTALYSLDLRIVALENRMRPLPSRLQIPEPEKTMKQREKQLRQLKRIRRNLAGGFARARSRQNPERDARIVAEFFAAGRPRGRPEEIARREGLSISRVYAIVQKHRSPPRG